MNKNLLFMLAVSLLFTGCTVHTPSIDVPTVSVDSPVRVTAPSSHHKSNKGCPPGLAKQGRC